MSDVSMDEFACGVKPVWCPGCGDYGVLNALKLAMVSLAIAPHELLLVSGIGCGSKLPDFMRTNGLMTLHGRPLPVATGAKLANQALTVVVVDGDGDAYGIGGNHFIHTIRRNPDITHVVEDNQIYGLTKGQYSPTTPRGTITPTSPEGAIERALNPLALALVMGATFVARGFASDPKHLAGLIAQGIQHKGYALIDVLQPCVVFNQQESADWYRKRVYKLEESAYDSTDRGAAAAMVQEWDAGIPIGVLYREEGVPTYEDQVSALAHGPLVAQRPMYGRELEGLKQRFL